MLFISLEDREMIVFYVGEKMESFAIEDIKEIQADGDELEYIVNNFTNVPHAVNCRVVTYYGDIARFIMGNWGHRSRYA